MSLGRPGRLAALGACVALALSLVGCGGGSSSTVGTRNTVTALPPPAEKVGFVPIGGGRYRLDGCVAERIVTGGAVEREQKKGPKVLVDPTGTIAVVTDGDARCVRVFEEALASLNVP